jgi:pimeloyl-ACP methyl ester carboxylesterase
LSESPYAEPQHGVVVVNGLRLHYVVGGDGPPAVLIHGEGASVLDWEWVAPSLSSFLRVYTVDLPGHGDSDKPKAPYSAELLTDSLIAFIDALELERVVLVGHSLGGMLAARVARRVPDRVSALCLIDSGGLGRYINPSNVIETLPGVGEVGQLVSRSPLGRLHRALLRAALLYARWWRVQPAWLAEQQRLSSLMGFPEANLAINRSTVDMWGQKELILEDLPHIQVPTLVVWGAEDLVLPLWQAYVAVAALPDARLHVLPTCGHMPHVECPKAFVDSLSSFLEQRLA